MRKVIQLDGGIGRVICALPAIERCHALTGYKPDIITGWPEVFWNNPHVRKVYSLNREWLFDDVIKHGDFCLPDPYLFSKYYRQEMHMVEAFDFLINGSTAGFQKPKIYLSVEELESVDAFTKHIKEATKKNVIVAFQPFAATFQPPDKDATNRSLSVDRAKYIADGVNATLLNCSKIDIDHPNVWFCDLSTRQFISVVSGCDLILSVESVVAHLGASYDKKGVEIFGSTTVKNAGWDNYVNVTRDGYPKSYYPFRFNGYVEENNDAMSFTNSELDFIIEKINSLM